MRGPQRTIGHCFFNWESEARCPNIRIVVTGLFIKAYPDYRIFQLISHLPFSNGGLGTLKLGIPEEALFLMEEVED
jgi:hypothetical protein